MPAVLSKIPAGLLGFLGIKNGGEYPQQLLRELVPTWDVASLYYGFSFNYGQVISNFNAPGANNCAVPPVGEVWAIHDCSCAITAGAGEAATVALIRSPPTNLFTVNISETVTVGAAATAAVALRRDTPLILSPGDNLGFIAYDVTGTLDFYFSYRYSVLTM